MNEQKIILDVKNLSVQFKTLHGLVKAVNDISFDLKKGETLGILGESGSGKSVTVSAILGLLEMPPAEITGNIYFDTINLTKISPKEMQTLRGKRISLIHQDPVSSLNPLLTVGYQLCEMLKVHQPGLSQSDAKKKAIELMEKVKIPSAKERIKSYPFELSGGMCQRILIALAISLEPDILIADEPTTALDVTVQSQIMDLLQELKSYSNMSMILITHDIGLVAENTTETLVMYAGKIFEKGPTEKIISNPNHPYTQGLIDSIPRDQKKGEKLFVIEGSPPVLTKMPKGCPFHTRCKMKKEICVDEIPLLKQSNDNRLSACHFS